MFARSVQKRHFRPRKAAEGAFVLPPRPGRRTHCAGTGGVATLPRAVPRNVPRPPQLSGERRGAASGSFGESPTSCTEYRGAFRRPKHFLFHMLRGGTRLGPEVLTSARRAATGAQSTNPATVPPPAKLFCSLRTINLESAAERARRASAPTHTFWAPAAPRDSPARLREPF